MDMLFNRLNNAFIHRMSLRFCSKILPLLYYLQANASDLQCPIGALHTRPSGEVIDHALVEFIGVHLQAADL